MADHIWVLIDPSGKELRSSEGFSSKEEAEAWMGAEWASLRDEGAGFVALRCGGEQLYKMSLSEA
jgi:hypothetical protein